MYSEKSHPSFRCLFTIHIQFSVSFYTGTTENLKISHLLVQRGQTPSKRFVDEKSSMAARTDILVGLLYTLDKPHDKSMVKGGIKQNLNKSHPTCSCAHVCTAIYSNSLGTYHFCQSLDFSATFYDHSVCLYCIYSDIVNAYTTEAPIKYFVIHATAFHTRLCY
jgi:hypothetical protein